MSRIRDFIKKYKDKEITIFLFVFFVSLLSGYFTVKIAKQLPMFESEKSAPDFFMNKYFKWSVKYSRFKPYGSVVLLEAKDLDMNDLAVMLKCLDSMQPKVIALDILHEYSQEDDSAFLDALINCKSKLVLPIAIDDNNRLRTPFYFGNEGLNDSIFGSVIFDDPWHKQYMHNGFPSFAYLVAKNYLDKNPDTTKLVDYRRMQLIERIQFDKDQKTFYYSPDSTRGKRNETPSLCGKIVLVGTTDRTIDPIHLKFPIVFNNEGLFDNYAPGMIVLSYQIRSYIDRNYQIKKLGAFPNIVISSILLSLYIVIAYFLWNRWDDRLKNSNRKRALVLWVFMPLLKVFFLVLFEFLIIALFIPLVSLFGMPNLWYVMASLPYVNCASIMYSNRIKRFI